MPKGPFGGVFYRGSGDVRLHGIGIYRTFLDLGGLAGPVIVSTIAGSFGGIRGYLLSFYFCIILVIALIAMTVTLKETKPAGWK